MAILITSTLALLFVFLAYVLTPIYKYNIQTCNTKEEKQSVYLATAIQAVILTIIFITPIATIGYLMQ